MAPPLQYSCLENPMDGGAWWAAVHRVVQSRTRLKWLSSSSSSMYFIIKSWVQSILYIHYKARCIAEKKSTKMSSDKHVYVLWYTNHHCEIKLNNIKPMCGRLDNGHKSTHTLFFFFHEVISIWSFYFFN